MDYLLVAAFLYILVILMIINDEEIINETIIDQNKRVKTIAHRGGSGYAPENTFAAFNKAIELKADYIELDVQMSHDGELIVVHDTTINRTTNNNGQVKTLDTSSLKKLDAGKWYSDSYQNERIPTLNEVLNRYQNKIGFLIELKNPELYPGIEKKLATLLKAKRLHERKDHSIIVQSFNQQAIKRFSKLTKSIPTGLLLNFHPSELTTERLKSFSTFVSYINPPAFWIDQTLVQKVHQAGMKVFCWTVNDQQLYSQVKKMNVDGIITDFPDLPNQIPTTQTGETLTRGYKNITHDEEGNDGSISGIFSSFLFLANAFLKELQILSEENVK